MHFKIRIINLLHLIFKPSSIKRTLPNKTILVRGVALFSMILQISLMFGSTEGGWIVVAVSVIHHTSCCVASGKFQWSFMRE